MFTPEQSVFIIAEAGVNHNGSVDLAQKLVAAAKSAGADAIKFQTFDPAALTTERVSKAGYQKKNTDVTESQQEMLKKLVLDKSSHYQLKRYTEDLGLMFLSTAFDAGSLKFLDQELGLGILKISSGPSGL